MISRREFLARIAAGAVITSSGLWVPGEKLISIPSRKVVVIAEYQRMLLEYLDQVVRPEIRRAQSDLMVYGMAVIGTFPDGVRRVSALDYYRITQGEK